MRTLTTPLSTEECRSLKAGERVLLSGTIYTARDAAHKRMVELLAEGKPLPMDVTDQVIYYAGPCPAKPGAVIGSCGPTTSYRMDAYAPTLMEQGLSGMIGKGKRSQEVIDSMKTNGAVYFAAIGGCGALISKCVKSARVIAFPDLGPEALRELYVENFPLTVIIDSEGNNLYEIGKNEYQKDETDM